MSSNFLGDLDFGKNGEAVVKAILDKRVDGVQALNEKGFDLRDDLTWQKIEVKSDRWALKTNNICLELWSHIGIKSEGWLQYSPAEVLAYVLYSQRGSKAEELIFYNLIGLRDYVYWSILLGDWNNPSPQDGRIVAAKLNGSVQVRNLLLPRQKLRPYMLESIRL